MSVSRLMLAASLFALSLPAAAQTPEETAIAALDEAPVWDGHNDVPGQLRGRFQNVIGDFDFSHTLEGEHWTPGEMHTDIARLRQGKVGVQWWSVYVSASLEEPVAVQTTIEQIDVLKRLIAENPDDMTLALSSADVEAALAEGKIAGMIGMEGGHSIGTSLAVLRQMYDLGARYMTLTHSSNTSWADSATDDPEHDGLTDWGVKLVQEMARLGMMIDLSHVSEATMIDALDATDAPVMFSHSGARAVTGHARNVPDAVLQRLPEHDGIVMVVALPGYISEGQRVRSANRAAEKARLESLNLGNSAAVEAGLVAWDQANPMPDATIADMADHIDHIRDLIGVDYIGIGGDYDGMFSGPVGMEDVTGYPALFTELARRGYSQEDLEKISSRNMMRVLKKAEAYAAGMADVPPIETPTS